MDARDKGMEARRQAIRKVAVLVSSLDMAAADAVLDQMGAEPAQQIRQAIIELGDIEPAEQQRVIEEFFRTYPELAPPQPARIELDGPRTPVAPLARKRHAERDGYGAGKRHAERDKYESSRPFHFLQEAEADKLVRVLAGERPQTIALVLSHLPPEQAGGVLNRLPSGQQAEVIRRLVDLEETEPEILQEVERALESRLSQLVGMQRRRVAGLSAVADILAAADQPLAARMLDNLAAHDPSLADTFGPPALSFEELAELDDAALGVVFRAADRTLAVTALVGAPPELIERVLGQFPASAAKTARREIEQPGPIRLSDVEDARGQIAALARRLAMEGRVQVPERGAVMSV